MYVEITSQFSILSPQISGTYFDLLHSFLAFIAIQCFQFLKKREKCLLCTISNVSLTLFFTYFDVTGRSYPPVGWLVLAAALLTVLLYLLSLIILRIRKETGTNRKCC